MNFQAVTQANGNNVTMFGVITEFTGEGINPNSNKPYKKAKITDDNNETHTVTLRGVLPPVTLINQRAQFNLSTYPGNYQGQPYTGYSGFWNSNAQVNQQPAPQQPQAPAPQSRTAPPPPPKTPNYDARNQSIERQCVWKAAAEYCGLAGLTPDKIPEIARAGLYFVKTENDFYKIPKPDPSITEGDENISF